MFEVCVDGIESLKKALSCHPDRIELCSALPLGGLTPSFGLLKQAAKLQIENPSCQIFVLIRPRHGDFLYSEEEFACILEDIQSVKDLGFKGVVVGALTKEGRIDLEKNQKMLQVARPMSITFHKAIDRTKDITEAVKDLVSLGYDRVLSSGGKKTALEGVETLKEMEKITEGRLKILVGGGVRSSNFFELITKLGTGDFEFHSAALCANKGKMEYFSEVFGPNDGEYSDLSSEDVINMIEALRKTGQELDN